MPSDARRLPTPSVCFDPLLYVKNTKASFFLEDGLRSDGRGNCDLRDMKMRCGFVTKATGSAYCEIGKTKVICSVHGPKDIEQKDEFQMQGKIKCEFKFAPFSCSKRRDHKPANDEIEISEILTESLKSIICLKKFPRSQIELYIVVLDNEGCALSAAFMAASLALADASIDTFDIMVSCSVRVIGKELFIVDPNQDEESLDFFPDGMSETNNGLVTVAVLPTMNQVSAYLSTGLLSSEVLNEAMELCISSAQSRYNVMRDYVTEIIKASS